jgi:prophage regulatory protein
MTTPLPERCLRLPEVQEIARYSKMHIDRLEKQGKFPRRIRLGDNRVVWRLSEVMDWLASKSAGIKTT